MLRIITGFLGRMFDREAKQASKVLWDSARAATYAPFVVSTVLMVMHRLDSDHWSQITLATIAADGAKSAAESIFDGVKGVVGKVGAIWGGTPDDGDDT
jgi:hypothetical protein